MRENFFDSFMKTVLLDENLPQPLRLRLPEFDVSTVGFLGWSGVQNGDLILRAEGQFDVLVTGDENLRYQQNLVERKIAIVEVPFTRLDEPVEIRSEISQAIQASTVSSYTVVQ